MTHKKVRFVAPVRAQPTLEVFDAEDWLADDHPARLVWAFVEMLDLTEFYDLIEAVEGGAGRPASDPRVLLALWLLAILDGIGSARALERRVASDLAYRWLAGGVPVNYHTLSDFRRSHTARLETLMCRSLAALIAEGLVTLDEVLVDGTKVKVAAGRKSYRTRDGLERHERRVRERITVLGQELDDAPEQASKRRRAARERAARERLQRIEQARAALDKADAERARRAKRASRKEKEKAARKPPEASTTDGQARKMRFASGAIAPGYNVQLATTPDGFILAPLASDKRSDAGLLAVMVARVAALTGLAPKRVLADASYAVADDIVALAGRAIDPVEIYASPRPEKADMRPENVRRRARRRAQEPDAIKAWRARMASEAGQAIYKKRKRIETTNAHLHNRNIGPLRVIGQATVQAVTYLHALAHNLANAARLRAA